MKTKAIVAIFTLVLSLLFSSVCDAEALIRFAADLTSERLFLAAGCRMRKLLFLKKGTKTWGLKIWELRRSQIG
jgi:hypothetical protein